jgi:Icc-related predicted phosphoesterase
MRIVAVADTHTFEKDLGGIPDGDVFVHAGDLLRAGTLDELGPVVEWIRSLPHREKVVVAGNHDWCFVTDAERARQLLRGIVYLQDSETTLYGARFWGSPWQPEYNDWAFNLPRGPSLAAKWAQIPEGVDVLITHGPPLGFGDRGPIDGRNGCEDLLRRVRQVQPKVHLFGHIHQDGGLWHDGSICFANVTTWECERAATVVDLDPSTGRLVEVSVPPRTTLQR